MRVNLIRCLTFLLREFSWLEAEGSRFVLRSFQIDAGRPFYGVLAWVCLCLLAVLGWPGFLLWLVLTFVATLVHVRPDQEEWAGNRSPSPAFTAVLPVF